FDECDVIIEHESHAECVEDTHAGAYTCDEQAFHSASTQQHVEVGTDESAVAVFRDNHFTGKRFQSRMKLGAPGPISTGQKIGIFKLGPDWRVRPLVPGGFHEANRKMMFTRLLYQMNKPGDHVLHKCHIAPPFTGRTFGMAKIVLHIDDNQYS